MPSDPKWYLGSREEYYVPARECVKYPLRQGDVFAWPDMPSGWKAAQLVHPTCEIAKSGVKTLQVVRVEPFSELRDDSQRALVAGGLKEKAGTWTIAMAHTFFLWPWGRRNDPGYANFREIIVVNQDLITAENRVAALTHDCRVTFIRRWLYFRFRILLSLDQVRDLEAGRISHDQNFQGPRPTWAPQEANN